MAKKVFVSGCYDMLHSGHVAFFKDAARYGDLYVGIGSDATIFGLKARQTVCSEAERLYMVKAIRHVKDACINEGSGMMDFVKSVERVKPDIFVVNEDACGKKNRYGHPHPDTVERLSGCGSQILQTKESGAIIWKTDGHRITWKGWKTVREE